MRLRNTLLIGLWALSCGTGARADALVEELDLKAAYVFKATLNKPSKISAQTWMTQFFGLLCLSRGPFGQFAGR